jgi:hypothetical protein
MPSFCGCGRKKKKKGQNRESGEFFYHPTVQPQEGANSSYVQYITSRSSMLQGAREPSQEELLADVENNEEEQSKRTPTYLVTDDDDKVIIIRSSTLVPRSLLKISCDRDGVRGG